ncbi:MAG: phasin family protein [Paracoccaceae bacterium]
MTLAPKMPTPCSAIGSGTDWLQIFTHLSTLPFGLQQAAMAEVLKATAAAMEAQAAWLRALAQAQGPEQALALTSDHMTHAMAQAAELNARITGAVQDAAGNATDRHATPV